MRKLETKIVLIALPLMLVALATLTWVIFRENPNETIAFAIIILSMIIGTIVIVRYLKNNANTSSDRKTFDLDSYQSKKVKNIIKFLLLVVFLLSITFSKKMQIDFWLVSILMGVLFLINLILLQKKVLILDKNGIRHFLRWDLKWEKLKTYQLEKNEGILTLDKINGKTIPVKGIKKEDMEIIEMMINKYDHETTN